MHELRLRLGDLSQPLFHRGGGLADLLGHQLSDGDLRFGAFQVRIGAQLLARGDIDGLLGGGAPIHLVLTLELALRLLECVECRYGELRRAGETQT